MNPEPSPPSVHLEPPRPPGPPLSYSFWGIILGGLAGVLVGHPVAMTVQAFHSYVYEGTPFPFGHVLRHSFMLEMWPMILLYLIAGATFGGVLGYIFQRLQENRRRLDNLHQEFEIQVATLRHHYKNLSIGIQGFSGRIRKKLDELVQHMETCHHSECPTYPAFRQDLEVLERNIVILEDASQRLSHTLSQELFFLKALTAGPLVPESHDFFPFLVSTVNGLLGLRFRDKDVQVEINGQPLADCRDSLTFYFEPYTMEVILQNILSNAMRYGDFLRIRVEEAGPLITVEVEDNGPGMDVVKLKEHLLTVSDRRETDSSHLGLRVSLHLLEKSRGQLYVRSRPGEGAAFILNFPKHPRAPH